MAKERRISPQPYPRIEDEDDKYYGFLDDKLLKGRQKKISKEDLKETIKKAIKYANLKSSRSILNINKNLSQEECLAILKKEGRNLFKYFLRYHGDPASTAFDCLNQHYAKIALEQFRNRTIQKERMNSGWRYQYIAKETAILTQRFESISDIGTAEADFNAVIKENFSKKSVSIYVSVKNRSNTMGGQDWPKAIRALEDVARR